MSEWLKAQPDYLGAQGKTCLILISISTMEAFRTRSQRFRQSEDAGVNMNHCVGDDE